MAYFLGINVNGDLKPLKLTKENGDIVPNEILSLVAFTSSFSNECELIDYLIESGSLNTGDGKLVYLIDKGQKGHKTYHIIPGCEQIIYSDFRSNFIPSVVRKKLHDKELNLDFIEHLYAFYLKKYGIYLASLNLFKGLAKEPYELRKSIVAIMKYPISEPTRLFLYKILDVLNAAIVRGSTRFFTDDESQEYFALVDTSNDYFSLSDKDVIALCKVFSTKVKNNNIAALGNLAGIYRIVGKANSDGYDSLCDFDKEDIPLFIDNFLDFTIYNYDKQRRDFKRVDGKKKLQARNMFDLGVFLTDYDNYEIYLYEAINSENKPDYDENDFEEFLEEDDFARINTTSEEQGIVLRITDDQRYSG